MMNGMVNMYICKDFQLMKFGTKWKLGTRIKVKLDANSELAMSSAPASSSFELTSSPISISLS